MQPKYPKRWFYILVPVLSTIFTVVLTEIGFAVFQPVPFSIESNMYFELDRFTGYRLKPNSIGTFQNLIPAITNNHGHRDDVVSLEKPENVFRIMLLGDSFTVGANVAQDHTYANVLELLINENSSASIEIVNTGVGGWEPFQYAQYYEYYGQAFSPDLIMIGFFVGNDAYNQAKTVKHTRTAIMGRRISPTAALDPLIKLKVFLYNNSNIARLILNKGPIKRDVTRKNCADFSERYIQIQKRRLKNHLKWSNKLERGANNAIYQVQRIKEIADRDSIPLILILIPDENQVNVELQEILLANKKRSRFDFDMPQTMLTEMFDDMGVSVIDLLPFYKKDSRCLYMNDTHWTPEGHALAAKAILKYIIDSEILNLTKDSSRRPKVPPATLAPP